MLGIGAILFISILYGLFYEGKKNHSWQESYTHTSKEPYGTYILHELLGEIFDTDSLKESNEEIFDQLVYEELAGKNYIIINNYFPADEADVDEMVRFIREGNQIFIAARGFSDEMTDRFDVQISVSSFDSEELVDIQFEDKNLSSESYTFPARRMGAYFSKWDDRRAIVLAKTEDKEAKLLKFPIGKGALYLSSDPIAFTNFFMVHPENHEFVSNMLSYLPDDHDVIWDEYYKVRNLRRKQFEGNDDSSNSDSAISYIMRQESLRWGFWVIIISLLLYAIFEAKRTQRIIPIIKPLPNTTLDFTETVGRLYFQQTDHKKVASKKIKIFLEYIRSHYFLKTQEFNSDFLETLAGKSGITLEETKKLFRLIDHVQKRQIISEDMLIELNNYIDHFYREGAR